MGDDTGETVPLTVEQRRLVSENIGLVAVHLRRRVRNLHARRFDRDRDDLFQEGCLGLMRAAVTFRSESGIPFAAYALPRIHHAVSKALLCKFSTVYMPPYRTRPDDAGPGEADPIVPKVFSLSGKLGESLRDRRPGRTDVNNPSDDVTTVGQRLREKYERAVWAACENVGRGASLRGDRHQLARILADERLLIPRAEARRPLRQIARETHSSFARVTQCEKQLTAIVHDLLDADPEFHELRHCAAAQPHGDERPIDPSMERRLAEAGAAEMVSRYRCADPTARARVLHDLLDRSEMDIEVVIRDRFRRLSSTARRRMLDETTTLKSAPRRTDRHGKRTRHAKYVPRHD